MHMKIILSCTECGYQDWGATQKPLMNKIIMWNHVKKAHAAIAERIMRMYQTLPSDLYDTRIRETVS